MEVTVNSRIKVQGAEARKLLKRGHFQLPDQFWLRDGQKREILSQGTPQKREWHLYCGKRLYWRIKTSMPVQNLVMKSKLPIQLQISHGFVVLPNLLAISE